MCEYRHITQKTARSKVCSEALDAAVFDSEAKALVKGRRKRYNPVQPGSRPDYLPLTHYTGRCASRLQGWGERRGR